MASRDAVRITTAPTSRSDELATRQRRYAISMTIRTVCFLAGVAVGPGWLRWVLMAGAVFLPYIAVVMANTEDQRADAFRLEDGSWSPELEAGSTPEEVSRHQ